MATRRPAGDLRTKVVRKSEIQNRDRSSASHTKRRAPPSLLQQRTSLRPSATLFRVFSISCNSFRVDAILPAKIHRIFTLAPPFDVPSARHRPNTNQIDYWERCRGACALFYGQFFWPALRPWTRLPGKGCQWDVNANQSFDGFRALIVNQGV
jgi:hypothetical protein